MRGRLAALVLFLTVIVLQYPLWLGKGGWLKVKQLEGDLAAQRELNQTLEARNAEIDAEVRDLKTGLDAIEERARYELGLVKADEMFVQLPMR